MNHHTVAKKNPPWSSFYNATIDQNDFMIIATIQNLNQYTSKQEIIQLLITIRHSITRNMTITNTSPLTSNIASSSKHLTPITTSTNARNPYNFILDYNVSNFNKLLYINLIVKYKQTYLPIIEITTKIHILKPFNLTLFGQDQLCILEFIMKDLNAESISFNQSIYATSIPTKKRPRFLLATSSRRKGIKTDNVVLVSELQTYAFNPINRAAYISIVPIHKTKLLGLKSSSSNQKKKWRGTKNIPFGLVKEPRT